MGWHPDGYKLEREVEKKISVIIISIVLQRCHLSGTGKHARKIYNKT